MILETWFILAVTSAVAGGVSSFLYKIAAKERIDIVLLSFCSAVIGTILLFIALALFSDFSGFWHPMLIFALLTVTTYLITNITKVKSLENIDSAIFFPLYKVFGPGLVVVFSIVIFSEAFSVYEWVGLILSFMIPLLLITKAEDIRQINLKTGLIWLGISVLVGSISAVFWKQGADLAPNTWMYIFVGELFMIPIAFAALYKKYKGGFVHQFNTVRRGSFIKVLMVSSIANTIGAGVFVFALTTGGTLGIVYTINSLYILIPIVLSIIFYKEHWNIRKVVAIILSVVALSFFG